MADAGGAGRRAELHWRLEAHWMERLALPLLAIGFSLSVTALACDLLTFLAGPVRPSPWIFAGCALAAVAGAYGAQARERANAPFSAQAVELAAVLALSYAMLRAGGLGSAYPLLSPAALRAPEVYVPLALAFLSWRLASTAGARSVWIGSIEKSLGEQVAAKLAWDQESVVSASGLGERRDSVTRFFALRALGWTLAGCVAAAGAFESFPEAATAQPVWRVKVTAALVFLLLFGLLQLGAAHLYRLHSIWDATGVEVTAGVYERWLGQAAIAVGAALLVAIAVPAFSVFDFHATVDWVSDRVSGFFARGLEIFNRQVRGGPAGSGAPAQDIPVPVPSAGVLLAIAFELARLLMLVLAVPVALGAVLLLFFRGEWRKLPGLLRLPVLSFLWIWSAAAHLGKAAAALFSWAYRLARRAFERKDAPGRPAPPLASELRRDRAAPAGSVRRYLVRLVEEAAQRGYPLMPHQTAREFTEELARRAGGVEEELRFLARRYEEVRYGRREERPADEAPVRAAYERVVARLSEKEREGA